MILRKIHNDKETNIIREDAFKRSGIIPTGDTITRYKDGSFIIDIIETETRYELWIGEENVHVSNFVFCAEKNPDITREDFLEKALYEITGYEMAFDVIYGYYEN